MMREFIHKLVTFFAIIGCIILIGAIFAPLVLGSETTRLGKCYDNAEYLASVTHQLYKGRSRSVNTEFEDYHRVFLVRFAYSEFGRRFSAIENAVSYFELCIQHDGSIPLIERDMRRYMGVKYG